MVQMFGASYNILDTESTAKHTKPKQNKAKQNKATHNKHVGVAGVLLGDLSCKVLSQEKDTEYP
jgi:hypothetical protein